MSDVLLTAERDGLASMLLDVQRECIALRSALDAAEARVTALEAEKAELMKAVGAVTVATIAYLPPDGISKDECISRVLAATDNPEINAIMLGATNGRS